MSPTARVENLSCSLMLHSGLRLMLMVEVYVQTGALGNFISVNVNFPSSTIIATDFPISHSLFLLKDHFHLKSQ